ncbi:MAG TPA: RNA polymerase sigma factor [Planctomycetota bacterium]|nr:RNA polymerase sigma factor [Planctomycetota bacterium]
MPTTAVAIEALLSLRDTDGSVTAEHFWVLLERFRAGLVNQAFAILSNQQDAEDVAQETLCKAFVELPRLRDVSKLGAWLRQINRHAAFSLKRKRNRQREERLATGQMHSLPADTTGPQAAPDDEIVLRAVDSLPEIFRETVVLRYWEKLSTEEIAIRLGVPAGTVRSRLTRADGMLARKLAALLRTGNNAEGETVE